MAYNKQAGKEIGHVIDFGAECYLRQEGKGIVLGAYEKACVPWSPKETPWSFGQELLQPDLDRIAPSLEVAFRHFPKLENVGIKRVINGPFTFAPDGNPLVGPVRGRTNFWSACGVMAGFSQGGGVGLALSNWMVDGDPGFDIWGMDVARYGDWATRTYTNAKVRENYARRFSIRFPNEELPAARPLQTTPLYDTMIAQGAVMGDSWGMETPLWFAPAGHRGEGHRVVPPLQRLRADQGRVQGGARGGGRDRDRQLRQVRDHRPGRRAVAAAHDDQHHAQAGPHHAHAHAQSAGQDHRRLHDRQGRRRPLHDVGLQPGAGLPHALVRAAPAQGWFGADRAAGHEADRPVDRRAEVARTAAAPDRRRRVQRSLQVHGLPRDGSRHGARQGEPRHLYR